MELQQFKKIVDELFLGLQIGNDTINKIFIFENYNETGRDSYINDQKNIFEFKKLITRVKLKNIKLNYLEDFDFSFKIPINPENLLKSFINQFTGALKNKEKKENQELVALGLPAKKENNFFDVFKNKNKNYFSNHLVYATTYGLGYYCLYLDYKNFNDINKQIGNFLESQNIVFKNEFSDAFWVYRFKFKSNRDENLKLLNNLLINY